VSMLSVAVFSTSLIIRFEGWVQNPAGFISNYCRALPRRVRTPSDQSEECAAAVPEVAWGQKTPVRSGKTGQVQTGVGRCGQVPLQAAKPPPVAVGQRLGGHAVTGPLPIVACAQWDPSGSIATLSPLNVVTLGRWPPSDARTVLVG